jgi:hypothetical protein
LCVTLVFIRLPTRSVLTSTSYEGIGRASSTLYRFDDDNGARPPPIDDERLAASFSECCSTSLVLWPLLLHSLLCETTRTLPFLASSEYANPSRGRGLRLRRAELSHIRTCCMIRATTSSSSISSKNCDALPVDAVVIAFPASARVSLSLEEYEAEGAPPRVPPPSVAAVDPNEREFELRNEGKRFLMTVALCCARCEQSSLIRYPRLRRTLGEYQEDSATLYSQ